MSFLITLRRDDASRDVALVHDQLANPDQRRAMMKAVGVRAEKELRAWWIKRDAENPNKMGWPRQHFWSRIRRATAFDPAKTTESTATVVVADPALSAKINGATIRPTEGRKALAIPMHPDAYGVQPRSGIIPGLFVLRLTSTNGAYLVRKEGTGAVNLTFYYRLVPQVTVPADPQALPPREQLGAALGATALSWFHRHAGGSN